MNDIQQAATGGPDFTPKEWPQPAPLDGCKCNICRWCRWQRSRDEELEENYARYLAGKLISFETKE